MLKPGSSTHIPSSLAPAPTLALVMALGLLATVAQAQTNAEVYAGIQYNFATPGARSLGLGGAFIGLADDATAAFTNPAGLTILVKPEVSFEGRQTEFTTTFTGRGHSFAPARNQGFDTINGLTVGESDQEGTDLSFLSFVYPKGRWSVAVFRHHDRAASSCSRRARKSLPCRTNCRHR